VCDAFLIIHSRYKVPNLRHQLCAFHKFSLEAFLKLHYYADGVYFFSINPAGLLSDWFLLAWGDLGDTVVKVLRY